MYLTGKVCSKTSTSSATFCNFESQICGTSEDLPHFSIAHQDPGVPAVGQAEGAQVKEAGHQPLGKKMKLPCHGLNLIESSPASRAGAHR